MASGEDSQTPQTVQSTTADELSPVNGAPGADAVTVADSSASTSSVTESQNHHEQPQSLAPPPKPR